MDFILRALTEINDKLRAAWAGNRCLVCPLAELSAIAAATLQLYKEQGITTQQVSTDHWTNYRKDK